MTFEERIDTLQDILDDIQCTSSLNEKREVIDNIPLELKDDFNCIIECLNGKHIFGYKMSTFEIYSWPDSPIKTFKTVREAISWLEQPRNLTRDLSMQNIASYLVSVKDYWEFFQPIVDRELKLGIGSSLLDKSEIAPMLAKKYEGYHTLQYDIDGYFVTEKLDGNRCIAFFADDKWNFVSRNGKPMYVNFDMTGLPTELVYDGEILSREQVEMSNRIARLDFSESFKSSFNNTSGTINRHTTDKDLVYNIFDIQVNWPYVLRRRLLDDLEPIDSSVRILPVLARYGVRDEMKNDLDELLFKVTNIGGEGLMINRANGVYSHKRTKDLLKYKDVKTMDMLVLSVYGGTGKYEGQCGGLTCQATTPDGKVINCNVGTGLSDVQRLTWRDGKRIIGKIVEVEYFSLSQDETALGSNYYSLRFPRLKKVRNDKISTSVY